MQSIENFILPDAPESTVELPQGLTLISAATDPDENIRVYYMDSRSSDELVTLSWYVLGESIEVADNFPGKFFKAVEMGDGYPRFLFFKQNAKKRDPIVAKVPGAKENPADGGAE